MLAILSAFDESVSSGEKDKVSFVHLNSNSEDEMKIEASPLALALSRQFNLKKVYLFYGEKGKITYDYD